LVIAACICLGPLTEGGSDGLQIAITKPIKCLARSQRCVSPLCSDGKKLAIAVSYTWEQGERSHPADAIVIKDLADESVRAK
jgi:cell cycle arrest protein BUB3